MWIRHIWHGFSLLNPCYHIQNWLTNIHNIILRMVVIHLQFWNVFFHKYMYAQTLNFCVVHKFNSFSTSCCSGGFSFPLLLSLYRRWDCTVQLASEPEELFQFFLDPWMPSPLSLIKVFCFSDLEREFVLHPVLMELQVTLRRLCQQFHWYYW